MRRALAALLAAASASCVAPSIRLPSGAGVPVDPAVASNALEQATRCRDVRTLTAEIAVSGSAAGRRVRGKLTGGIERPASARLEAVAPAGPPVFIFVATGEVATLLLPRDDRILEHGRPEEVLDAVSGVPVDAAALTDVVTGCVRPAPTTDARAFGDTWLRYASGTDTTYLRRDRTSAPWHLVAAERQAWHAEFSAFQPTPGADLPSVIRLTSPPAAATPFDLKLSLSQVDINVPLGPQTFAIQTPTTAKPITLQELRQSGPLAQKTDAR